jgi:hypothetical protein
MGVGREPQGDIDLCWLPKNRIHHSPKIQARNEGRRDRAGKMNASGESGNDRGLGQASIIETPPSSL